MYVARVSDGDMLFEKAHQAGGTIQVTSAHVVVPGPRGVRRPALLLQYSLAISNNVEGQIVWSFAEVCDANPATGQVDLHGTLLERLNRQRGRRVVPFVVDDRSGSQ